jgi:DNA-binding transcriptional LysR family regulator
MEEKISQFYYKKSRIQQVKGFCKTVQHGSAKAAAEKMGLDPSTVSVQIKSLEDDLGVKLFDHVSKKLILNDKGKKFYEKAVQLVNTADGLFQEFLLSEDEEYQNCLKIGSTGIILSHLLPPYLSTFNKEYPNIELSLSNITKEECKQQILDNIIDCGISTFLFEEKIPVEFDVIKLKDYKSYWIMHKDHPLAKKAAKDITKNDIKNSNFVYIPELMSLETFENFIKKYQIKNYINTKNCNLEILKKLVNEGLCIGCIQSIYIDDTNPNIVYKDIEQDFEQEHSYYGIMIKKDVEKKAIENFLKVLNS